MSAALSVLFSTYYPGLHMAAAASRLETKAVTYGELFGIELESAVEFDDRQTAREVVSASAHDPDIRAMTLYGRDGGVIESRGDDVLPYTVPPDLDHSVVRTKGAIRSYTVVKPREGPMGILAVELSTSQLEAEKRHEEIVAALACVAALVVSFAFAFVFSRSLARRIGALAGVATGVANGDLDRTLVTDTSEDEVGQLVRAFNAMVMRLKQVLVEREAAALEENARLDRLVSARTRQLEQRHRDMRLFLDHVGQGFMVVEPTGALGPERSAVIEEWFGDVSRAPTLEALMLPIDPEVAAWFGVGWDSVFDGFLPAEVALEQLPKQFRYDGRTFGLAYRPMSTTADAVQSVLVVMTDITLEVQKQEGDALQRETMAALALALADPNAYVELLTEAERFLDALRRSDVSPAEKKRALHTLKGTTALGGLASVSERCHALESAYADGIAPSAADVDVLARRFTTATSPVRGLLASRRGDVVEMSRSEHTALVHAAGDGELGRRLAMLTLEPLDRRLEHCCEQALALAKRQGKRIDARHAPTDLRFDGPRWARFWSAFAHVVRNAVDHGIEAPDVRTACAKPEVGVLAIDGRVEGGAFVLAVRDDGRGVDWPRVREVALARGLPAASRGDLEAALFSQGLSTRAEVTDTSGRGVGLAAVKVEVEALGGRIRVESAAGGGTELRFVFPVEALAALRGDPLSAAA